MAKAIGTCGPGDYSGPQVSDGSRGDFTWSGVVHNDDGSFTDAASRIMKGDGLYMEHPARKARAVRAKSD